jgi:hypothetical protein
VILELPQRPLAGLGEVSTADTAAACQAHRRAVRLVLHAKVPGPHVEGEDEDECWCGPVVHELGPWDIYGVDEAEWLTIKALMEAS